MSTKGFKGSKTKRKTSNLSKSKITSFPTSCRAYADWAIKLQHDDVDLDIVYQHLHPRYNQFTGVEADYDGWPISYFYYTEGEKLPAAIHRHPVRRDPSTQPIVEPKYRTAWTELHPKYKDLLFVILMSASAIGKKIYYDLDQNQWLKRPNNQPVEEDTLFCLQHYESTSQQELPLMETLLAGRTPDGIASDVLDDVSIYFDETLHGLWILALLTDMTNGNAHDAVSCLFKSIKMLRRGLTKPYPNISLFNLTSAKLDAAFSVTTHSDTDPSTRSSTGSPKSKKIKVFGDASKGDTNKNQNCCSASSAGKDVQGKSQDQDNTQHFAPWPSYNRKYVDMVVVTYEKDHDIGKYLFLIEIFSHGKTWQEAQAKFCKELIHVLQAQSEVFGMLFGLQSVILYRAKKRQTGGVVIIEKIYTLTQNRPGELSSSSRFFSVSAFQEMVMDIFACLMYGVDNVTA